MDQHTPPPPHVLIFPLPLQGPVNSMLKLAELLLCLSPIHVTFLVTDVILNSLLAHTNISSHFQRYHSRFTLSSVRDGLPDQHPRSGNKFMELMEAMDKKTRPLFKEAVLSISRPSVSCLVVDGVMGFAVDVAEEVGLPFFVSRTLSPCCLWVHLCLPKLLESREVPFRDNYLDAPITSVPGMENFLLRRDLPGFCRSGDINDPDTQFFLKESKQSPRANGLILNTFEDLDGPILNQIRTLCPNLYPIGPIHSHLKSRLERESAPSSCSSLREVDRSCLVWLDKKPAKSVIYVSFGSLATVPKDQLVEFWHGLVNSRIFFLWVIRSDAISGKGQGSQIPEELKEGTKERGYVVEWAPQEEVLEHPSVGGFLTHSGWNSTLESIYEGVPMICWPSFLDQQINSRFVGEIWKLGLDMKDTCDRVVIENLVKDLMVGKKDEFAKSAEDMADLARRSISPGGSSYCHLDRLIEDIQLMSLQVSHR